MVAEDEVAVADEGRWMERIAAGSEAAEVVNARCLWCEGTWA